MNDLDKRKAKATKEITNLMETYDKEVERITEELKSSGRFQFGLDANSENLAPLNKKYDEKLAEILAKYNLPPGTKLKLW